MRLDLTSFLLLLPLLTGFSWGEPKKAAEDTETVKSSEKAPPAAAQMAVVIDSNKDGKVSADEKKRALDLWSAQDKIEESAAEKALVARADTDKDGKLEAEEKKRMMQELSGSAAGETPSKKGEKK